MTPPTQQQKRRYNRRMFSSWLAENRETAQHIRQRELLRPSSEQSELPQGSNTP